MSDVRKLVALLVAALALGAAVFGVVRGLSATGPGKGTRLTVTIDPPLDANVMAIAQHVVEDRLDEKGLELRVTPAGDRIVAETSDQDPATVAEEAALLERTATLELRDGAGGSAVLDGRAIRRVAMIEQGVAIEATAPVGFKLRSPITFALDGKIKLAATPDHVDGASFHVPMASIEQAIELRSIVETGAAHPMHVVAREPFTRVTGFLPRAWPFLAAAGVLLALAGLIVRRR